MFYSHEILTSRKYGVATIWLVATLGSKSNLKKVSRKAILGVNVRKACETIITPDAPLALRLQSNLLYGVTRVYSQQCGYVLNDVESARNSMQTIFNALQTTELETEGVHQARVEQLTLQNDPNFLPDVDYNLADVQGLLESLAVNDSQQSYLSPFASSQGFSSSSHDIGGLILPPSHSSSVTRQVSQRHDLRFRGDSEAGTRLEFDDLPEDDLGLTIEPEDAITMGEIRRDQQPPGSAATAPRHAHSGTQGRDVSDPQGSGPRANPLDSAADTNVDVWQDNNVLASDPADIDFVVVPQAMQQQESTPEAAHASARRRQRVPKVIPLDDVTELHNSDLALWSTNYLVNMRESLRAKEVGRAAALARANAEFWVLGAIHDPTAGRPLDVFTGINLLEAFTGKNLRPHGQKRPRKEEQQAGGESRRVRSYVGSDEGELGRGVPGDMMDDDDLAFAEDDTVEQGRNAPTPLDDRFLSSAFPWNQSAGSRRPSNMPSSGSLDAARPGFSVLSHRGSHRVSASPLLGHGTLGGSEMEGIQFHDPAVSSADDDEFALFEPGSQSATQATEQLQWQRALMEGDGANFLAFVRSAIDDVKRAAQQATVGEEGIEAEADSIEFETLLPPAEHSKLVAAQAMLHVLSLGTKGQLDARQTEAFGPIVLRTPDAA